MGFHRHPKVWLTSSRALCWMDRPCATTTRCDSSTRGTSRNWCPWRTMSPPWWRAPWCPATPRRRGRRGLRVSSTSPSPGWWPCWPASWSRPSWWMLSGTCWSSCPCSGTGSSGKQVEVLFPRDSMSSQKITGPHIIHTGTEWLWLSIWSTFTQLKYNFEVRVLESFHFLLLYTVLFLLHYIYSRLHTQQINYDAIL